MHLTRFKSGNDMMICIAESKSTSKGNVTKHRHLGLVIGLIAVFVMNFGIQSESQAQYRPVYIVAHRCNKSTWAVNAVQKHGVNAIEADFWWKNNIWYVAHESGSISPPTLDAWLPPVGQEAKRPGTTLCFLHVDIKTPEGRVDILHEKLRHGLPGIYLLFDFGLVREGQKAGFSSAKDRIMKDPRSAFSMGFDDSPDKVNTFFGNQGVPLDKYWYEVGLAAGFVWSEQEQEFTRQAIRARNSGTGPKVLIWTFESENTVISWLKEGVDAILVNSSESFGRTNAFATDADVHVRNAKALANVKYATPSDNAFAIVRDEKKTYQVSIRTGTKSGAGTDSNIFITIYGPKGQTAETRLNGLISGDAFENGDTDHVTLNDLKDIGIPTKVRIRSDGKYWWPAWYLDYVTIDGRTARFGKWIKSPNLVAEAAVY